MAMSKKEMNKPTEVDCDVFSTNDEWYEKMLPHVLEASELPSNYTCEDVMRILTNYDYADVAVHAVGQQYYYVFFSSHSSGKIFFIRLVIKC